MNGSRNPRFWIYFLGVHKFPRIQTTAARLSTLGRNLESIDPFRWTMGPQSSVVFYSIRETRCLGGMSEPIYYELGTQQSKVKPKPKAKNCYEFSGV